MRVLATARRSSPQLAAARHRSPPLPTAARRSPRGDRREAESIFFYVNCGVFYSARRKQCDLTRRRAMRLEYLATKRCLLYVSDLNPSPRSRFGLFLRLRSGRHVLWWRRTVTPRATRPRVTPSANYQLSTVFVYGTSSNREMPRICVPTANPPKWSTKQHIDMTVADCWGCPRCSNARAAGVHRQFSVSTKTHQHSRGGPQKD